MSSQVSLLHHMHPPPITQPSQHTQHTATIIPNTFTPLYATVCTQVMPVTEMLQATCGRYHDLLGATLGSRMAAVVEADVLGELEVRTAAQHSQLVNDYNLPWQLEGAGEGPLGPLGTSTRQPLWQP